MDQPVIQRDAVLDSLLALAPDLAPDVVRDFLSRMDGEYFQRFQPADIIRHLQLVERLTPDHPCHVSVTEHDGGWLLVIVAYDYFSEFAAIAGLLSSHRLDIREGALYTYTDASAPTGPRPATSGRRAPARPGLSRKKIVDVFRVRPLPGTTFSPAEQRALAPGVRWHAHHARPRGVGRVARHVEPRRRDSLSAAGRFTGSPPGAARR